MKTTKKNITDPKILLRKEEVKERMILASKSDINELYQLLETSENGVSLENIDDIQDKYGDNIVSGGVKKSLLIKIFEAFFDPFTIILLLLAIVSIFTDYILQPVGEQSLATVIIITIMVLISGSLRFISEARSGNEAAALSAMIRTTTCVERQETGKEEIDLDDVVVGDIVHLSAGDLIPADMRIIAAKDLFISQSALTGESEPVEKLVSCDNSTYSTEAKNLVFMGSTVIIGSAKAVVVATGDDTMFGSIAQSLAEKPPMTSFEKGVNEVSWVLIRFMLIMVPIVFVINGITKKDWLHAGLFAISIAVGLTPEMLPMIVTTCLAKGARSMAKVKVILKNLNSIQSLGSMDILCTDKTGTLTQDRVILEYHLNIKGEEDTRVLRHGFLNSYYQTGLKNLMDAAIIAFTKKEAVNNESLRVAMNDYIKVDEIPFDFERRRMSVVVADKTGKTQMITKGAVEEMISISSFVEYEGSVLPLTDELKDVIINKSNELNDQGMRVIAVAQKTNPAPVGTFGVKDENEMVLIGYLAFLDPPKETTEAAIRALADYGVDVKVLTGDNEKVTAAICKKVGLEVDQMMLGDEVDNLSDDELFMRADKITVFAKLSPEQKARIVKVLRDNGHCVGYMGDGINDAAAMKASDVGISVDTAVDIAKESADVILLEKDLMVLERGVIEGRRTYANMIKYIKMTASSNFGNMFSVLLASAFLPFLPMESIHLLLLNLIYDISCIAIPWDNVDQEYLLKPRKWDASSVGKFMIYLGPVSSVFDIATYLLLYFIICPSFFGGALFHQLTDPSSKILYIALFQAGWFIESMWSQTLVIHMIRTPKLPFIQSRASTPLTLLTFAGITLLTIIPFTPIGSAIGLASLPMVYFAWLIAIIICYMFLITFAKKKYVKKFGELL